MTTAAHKASPDRRQRRKKVDPEIRRRADELHESGLPYQMAMAIAYGNLDLNDALERLARRDQVTRLMEKHDLSRALATQIAIGHAELDQVLARRRLDAHRTENRDRSILVAEAALELALTDRRRLRGVVRAVDAYSFTLDVDGVETEIHKLEVKYGYEPTLWKKVRKAVRSDKALSKDPKAPATRPQDRYSCSDRRMYGYLDSSREVAVTLLEGETLRGRVLWFSRYEFGLEVKGGVEVTIFRHALANLTEA
ncbi:MAG: sRNA-binding regulator protein Hfq [Myxococcota bacterium]|jgi:sRNA-binding regulator protein Hfq